MFYRYELLSSVQVGHILNLCDTGTWKDGKKSGSSDKRVKNNFQIDKQSAYACWSILEGAMENCDVIRNSILSCAYTLPHFCKYGVGCHYDWHTDHAHMGSDQNLRSDVSTTVFLNEDYEGGELEIKLGTELISVKLPAGWAFSYPTGISHRVKPITAGERKVAVLWVQSSLKDPMDRLAYARMQECITNKEYSPDSPEWEMVRVIDEQKMHLLRTKGDLRS